MHVAIMVMKLIVVSTCHNALTNYCVLIKRSDGSLVCVPEAPCGATTAACALEVIVEAGFTISSNVSVSSCADPSTNKSSEIIL